MYQYLRQNLTASVIPCRVLAPGAWNDARSAIRVGLASPRLRVRNISSRPNGAVLYSTGQRPCVCWSWNLRGRLSVLASRLRISAQEIYPSPNGAVLYSTGQRPCVWWSWNLRGQLSVLALGLRVRKISSRPNGAILHSTWQRPCVWWSW